MNPRLLESRARFGYTLLVIALAACGGGGPGPLSPPPAPPPGPLAPSVLDVIDIGNAGDASDIRLMFRSNGDVSSVDEFRVYAATQTATSGTLPTTGTFLAVAAASGQSQVRLTGLVTDETGAALVEGTAYVLFVQAWTGDAANSPVSGASTALTLARTDIVETLAALDAGTGGVEVDAAGNIYVADFGTQLSGGTAGSQVFRVTPQGDVSVFASGLVGASGNAFDSQGNLLQSNIANGTISRIAPDGTVTTLASGGGLVAPVGIAVAEGDTLYVASCDNNTIQRVAPDGTVSPFAGGALFSCPNGIALAADGNFYVANFGNGNLVRVTPDGIPSSFVSLPAANLGHVTAGNGVLYVAVRGAHQIWEVTLSGSTRRLAGTGARGDREGAALDATLSFTNDLALSPDGDILYFNDVDPGTSGTNVLSPSQLRLLRLDPPPGP